MKSDLNYRGRYANVSMPHGCLYLSNAGSRWVTRDMRFVLVLPSGERRLRLADYYSSIGNSGVIAYRYQGKRHFGFGKAHDGTSTRDSQAKGINALPHVFHKA